MLSFLGRVSAGEDLSMDDMAQVVDTIMLGQASDQQVALLLTALRAKGETIEEIAGAAMALRKHMTPIRTKRTKLIDTCGTGGGGSGTFNISTAAALVAAAAGAAVAKHGNRRITSKSGSADVLAELGVNIDAGVDTVQRCLDELGIGFCFAPLLHRSMRHVSAVRKSLGFPTIFNLLGPLCNPAGAPFQLLGVGKRELRQTLAAALCKLGTQRAAVVCGEDGLGEVTLSGKTCVTEVQDGILSELTWTPADFGLQPIDSKELLADGPAASARIIRSVLSGSRGPCRDIVVANAAAALWVSGLDQSLNRCAGRAAEAIDSRAAESLLARLIQLSNAIIAQPSS
jgi:anthranilate phosphoribosyltransferase